MTVHLDPALVTVHVLDEHRHPICGADRASDLWSGDLAAVCADCVVQAVARRARLDAAESGAPAVVDSAHVAE